MSRPTIEFFVLSAVCFGSVLLWFALNADFESALWWAVKTPGPIGSPVSSVRMDKVLICMSWSVLILGAAKYLYRLDGCRLMQFLLAALLTLGLVSAVQVRSLEIPYLNLVYKYGPLVLVFMIAKFVAATAFAFGLLTRKAVGDKPKAVAVAVTMAVCGLMLWSGLSAIVYPGISWR